LEQVEQPQPEQLQAPASQEPEYSQLGAYEMPERRYSQAVAQEQAGMMMMEDFWV
jgi:hypothetical protein